MSFRHGDEQSLEQSLSTFSSHISRIAHVFSASPTKTASFCWTNWERDRSRRRAALGRAILDQLDRIRCRAIVTTHLGDLETYAFRQRPHGKRAVEFDIESLRPTYRLLDWPSAPSNALRIA
ncbi:MAG: hypothetical protein U0798_17160 [Gemmataceae bacterium]